MFNKCGLFYCSKIMAINSPGSRHRVFKIKIVDFMLCVIQVNKLIRTDCQFSLNFLIRKSLENSELNASNL